MYSASFSPRFERDVKACRKKHWNMAALKVAIAELLTSDEGQLSRRYKIMHSLVHGWVTERFMWIQHQIPPKTSGCLCAN